MKWITRRNVKVDRVACPWLIQRFVDPAAEFLFVEGQEQVALEGVGLRALAEGFAAMGLPDEERLARQFPVYDALYEYARRKGELTDAT